jgi:hypothetical protein
MAVDDANQVAYCYVHKGGSTTWKTLLANISSNGNISNDMIEILSVHSNMNKYGIKMVDYSDKYENYTKLLIVRNPLDRLVSGYLDKMHSSISKFPKIQQSIIKQYRKDNSTNSTYPTFEEYVAMLLNESDKANMNFHWSPYVHRCGICGINYDFILRIETMQHDMPMFFSSVYSESNPVVQDLLNTLDGSETFQYNQRTSDENPAQITSHKKNELFSSLAKDTVMNIYDKYKEDFVIPGYDLSIDSDGTVYSHCHVNYPHGLCC